MDSIRVLHIAAGLAPRLGGPSRSALGLCQALAKKGAHVVLFSTNLAHRGHWLPFPTPVADVSTSAPIYLDTMELRYFEARWPTRYAFSPGMASAISRGITTYDLVHIHSLYLFPTAIAAYYSRKAEIPYIVQPHGVLSDYHRRRHNWQKALYHALIERRNLDRASAIHYTSEDELKLANAVHIKSPGFVVPIGLDSSEFADLPPRGRFRQRYGLRDELLVVFVGRIAHQKGLDLLVEGLRVVVGSVPDVHLVIAGPDDEGFGATVRSHIRRSGLVDRITMVDMVSGRQKLELLADADIWTLPSYSENFGIAVAEAMACGLPVVVSDRVNIHQLISQAGAGIVVACDSNEVAKAIVRLANDSNLRKSAGLAGRQLVHREFTWDQQAARMIRLYEGILERQPANTTRLQTSRSG